MESTSIPGQIQVSPSTYEQIKNHFEAKERELIECKGIGLIMTYFVGKPAYWFSFEIWLSQRKVNACFCDLSFSFPLFDQFDDFLAWDINALHSKAKPTERNLLHVGMKAIEQRAIEQTLLRPSCSRSVSIFIFVGQRYSVFPSNLYWRINKIWDEKNASEGSISKISRIEILKTT